MSTEKVKNKDLPAFASVAIYGNDGYQQDGLTKREYFAAMAMQGYFSNSQIAKLRCTKTSEEDAVDIAEISVKAAEALLKALENNNSTETK